MVSLGVGVSICTEFIGLQEVPAVAVSGHGLTCLVFLLNPAVVYLFIHFTPRADLQQRERKVAGWLMAVGAVRICRCCAPSTGRGGGCARPTPREEQWGAVPGGCCRAGRCHSWVKVGSILSRLWLSRFQAAPFPNWMCQCSGQSTLSHERTRVFWRKFAKLWKNCLSKSEAHECSLREPAPLQSVFCTVLCVSMG